MDNTRINEAILFVKECKGICGDVKGDVIQLLRILNGEEELQVRVAVGSIVMGKDLQKGWVVEVVDKVASAPYKGKIAKVNPFKGRCVLALDFGLHIDSDCGDLSHQLPHPTGRFPYPDDLFKILIM